MTADWPGNRSPHRKAFNDTASFLSMSSRCFQLSVGNSGFVYPLALTSGPLKQERTKTRISTVLRHLFLAVIQMGDVKLSGPRPYTICADTQ